ncbi:MAG: NUDIX domain-containing protein [Candidatus Saccharimonadales bacterium]
MGQSWKERHKVVPAVYVIFEKDGRVLLIRRAGTGYFDGYYSLPAGHLDGGEPAHIAAIREAKEEVGVDISPDDLHFVHTLHRKAEESDHERIDMFFMAKNYKGELQNMEPEKCDELRWASYEDLPENIVPEVRSVFKHLSAGRSYSTFNF